uniref:Tubulin--tyrosine ligase-like protein 9 n=1 Tax=Prymnesium polylepis TaxID=72548 RepID=A0A7S4HFZ1_9EUKA|mmetsp:Transcript_15684/g.39809  ORF Transcript_15684/g.39809 Transcript_15684/m.39809 type:complete len:102 (+) Transcript_15684:224-529(+)
MGSLVWRSLRAARGSLVPRPRCARSHLYALLAYDWVLDARGEPVLLEVNSHPAIADGTMAAVPRDVYTTLVRDVLGALVLPALDGRPPEPGGFEPVDGWAG